LFTNAFPYGKGEEFLENEILHLSAVFEKIFILPSETSGLVRSIPANVSVINVNFKSDFSFRAILKKHWALIFKLVWYEVVLSNKRFLFIRRFRFYIDQLSWKINHANQLQLILQKIGSQNIVLYCYWFDHWASLLSIIKASKRPELKFVSRIHGFDYEPSRRENRFIPFRCFEMHQVNAIYSISTYGINMINKTYPFFKNIQIAALGVPDKGGNNLSNTQCQIVSCSSMIALKRVHIIVDVLKHIGFPVKWTHFGDGPLMEELQRHAGSLPGNIAVDFKGYVPNEEVIRFYKNEPVDLFVNVSEIEGVPVSVMEAISFGIPCLAINVGGVSEIVNNQTGFLFPADFDPKDISHCIIQYMNKEESVRLDFRKGVKAFWKENFNSDVNYKKITELLLQK
jgi:glycosyltransferase involved in cell wall biosynthesis